MSDLWPETRKGRRREIPPVRLPDGTVGQHCSTCGIDQPRRAFVPGNPTCRTCRDELAAVHEPLAVPATVARPTTLAPEPRPWLNAAPSSQHCRDCHTELPTDEAYPWCPACRLRYVKRHPKKYGKQKKPQTVGASQNPSTGRSRQVPGR